MINPPFPGHAVFILICGYALAIYPARNFWISAAMPPTMVGVVTWYAAVVGSVAMIFYGGHEIAVWKRRHGLWGILGLLSWPGLLALAVMAFLPDGKGTDLPKA